MELEEVLFLEGRVMLHVYYTFLYYFYLFPDLFTSHFELEVKKCCQIMGRDEDSLTAALLLFLEL